MSDRKIEMAPDSEWYPAQDRAPRMLVPTLQETIINLRVALTRARDALERHRDPMVREIDRVLSK